jgi:hypothetical protein
MGVRLAKGFQAAQEAGGAEARRRLALRFGMTAAAAAGAPDSDAEVARMKDLLQQLIRRTVAI